MRKFGPLDSFDQEYAVEGSAADQIAADAPPDLQGVPNATKFQATAVSSNFLAAITLAAAGIPIFPVKLYQPAGATSFNKQPLIRGWQSGATADTDQVRKWWHKFPHAVPGIPCGHPNLNLVVVDVDRHDGGHDGVGAFQDLIDQRQRLPAHPTVETAGGGGTIMFSANPRVSRLATAPATSPKELMYAV
jgi:Bifunctional DNA primase/polymerase, N-terminal